MPTNDQDRFRRLKIEPWAGMLLLVLWTPAARAQDFADTQLLTNNAVFAAQDAAAQRRALEQQRIAELSQRAQQQDATLEAQAASVRQLQGELQAIRDERDLIELGEAFDGALQAGRWTDARAILANSVAFEFAGFSETPGSAVSADALVAYLTKNLLQTSVLPRSHQHVKIDKEAAVVTSEGYAWDQVHRPKSSLVRRIGYYEYHFERSADGWKIDAVTFRTLDPPS